MVDQKKQHPTEYRADSERRTYRNAGVNSLCWQMTIQSVFCDRIKNDHKQAINIKHNVMPFINEYINMPMSYDNKSAIKLRRNAKG